LFRQFPRLTARASELLGWDVAETCLRDPGGVLGRTAYTQPAVFLVNALAFRAQQSDPPGRRPPAVALGHSLGEFNALEAAGALDFEEGLQLVAARARITASVSGAMTAVLGMPAQEIRDLLDARGLSALDMVNFNSPHQTVLAGTTEDVERGERVLYEGGAPDIRRLDVSGPFHSHAMATVTPQWEAALARVSFRPPAFPVVSNTTGRPHEPEYLRHRLAEHVRAPVLWEASVRWTLDRYPDAV
ncbi:ACP S-malonyltransferase, partial [Streptomyces sp. WAC02707]|uniref:ACP S-malonyltransferase n=1 Tax=Streptomyces sp. WAC02707 TaxID=2487417 RepID=UPI000FB77959